MLRPVLAVAALALALLVVAPTMADVGEAVDSLDIRREVPFHFWKTEVHDPGVLLQEGCRFKELPLYSEVTQWPPRIQKDEPFTLGGIVVSPFEDDAGVDDVKVDLFLNETKDEPGVYLGTTRTDHAGDFELTTTIPFALKAQRYHLIAHAYEKQEGCTHYLHHWSDPELDVVSSTRLLLHVPDPVVVGREVNVGGRLLDSVGMPLENRNVTLDIGGHRVVVETGNGGRFSTPWTPTSLGSVYLAADFAGEGHYEGVRTTREIHVVPDHIAFDRLDDHGRLAFARSDETTVTGQVLLPPDRDQTELVLTFQGLLVAECAGCAPTDRVAFTPDADGRFSFVVHVASDQPTGTSTFFVAGDALHAPHTFSAHVLASTRLVVEASGAGWFAQEIEGEVRLVDDAGEPVVGDVAIGLAGGSTTHVRTDENGRAHVQMASACGLQRMHASYEGHDTQAPAMTTAEAVVCPLSLTPLGFPLWVWVAALAIPVVGAYVIHGHVRSRADVLVDGPPLALHVATPADAASGLVGPGESVEASVRLRGPLPEGHTLRIGTHLGMQPLEPDAQHEARWTFVPPRTGGYALRGEILDARGRVVTRRTAHLRVVEYAQEIEARYLELQRQELGENDARLTPRQFEAWLQERREHVEPEAAARLVHLFEEADYSPRQATRSDLLAFLRARQGVDA